MSPGQLIVTSYHTAVKFSSNHTSFSYNYSTIDFDLIFLLILKDVGAYEEKTEGLVSVKKTGK